MLYITKQEWNQCIVEPVDTIPRCLILDPGVDVPAYIVFSVPHLSPNSDTSAENEP